MEYNIIYKCLFKICVLGLFVCSKGGTKIKHLFYYDGYGEAKLVCNGSDVINITDYELINHPTDCSKAKCDLTLEDRNSIEACDGTSTCVIPIDDMSSCLKDRGFFRIDYTCQGIALNCDFEDGSCGWTIKGTGWRNARSGNNHYLTVNTNNNYREVRSNRIAGNERQCLYLFYSIRYSYDYIIIYREYMNGTVIDRNELAYYYYDRDYLEIPIMDAGDFKLVIGARGHYDGSTFRVDNIRITNTECGRSGVSEQIPHSKICKLVVETVSLDGCHSDYLSLSAVSFDPSTDNCNANPSEDALSACAASFHVTNCDVKKFVSQHPSCFNLNTLRIEYTCTGQTATTTNTIKESDESKATKDQTTTPTIKTIDKSDEEVTTNEKNATATNRPIGAETGTTHSQTGTLISSESDTTGTVVGLTIGGLLIIGLLCTVALVVYRRRNGYRKGKTEKGNNNLSASWHVDGQGAYMNSVQLSTKRVATGSVIFNNLATNNPSYEQGYIISSANKSVNKDESEYMNMPKQTPLTGGHNSTSEYNVLDPKETGFYRTNGNTYELASPTNENSDDEYAESGLGVYDISGNSRHKVKDTIYDHSVDDTYDTSNRGRQEDFGDYTYNHVFGKQTVDDYDIAGS